MTFNPGLIPVPSPALGAPDLAARLLEGSAALFPTDTLPALSACPGQTKQLWRLKKRPADKPLILMAASSQIQSRKPRGALFNDSITSNLSPRDVQVNDDDFRSIAPAPAFAGNPPNG